MKTIREEMTSIMLEESSKEMLQLLGQLTVDLKKSFNGNKTAEQRVRTGTIKFAKISAAFRRCSVSVGKKAREEKGQ